MSGRSRSPATTLFFEAQLLGMDELPDRAVIHLQPALAELGDEPAQGEVSVLDPLQEPGRVLARNRLRLVTAHLARRNAPGLTLALHPVNGGADANPELLRSPVTRQPAGHDRRNHPLPKINRVRFAHPCWPPSQPAWRIRNTLIWEYKID